jgi:hypothetical protein
MTSTHMLDSRWFDIYNRVAPAQEIEIVLLVVLHEAVPMITTSIIA